MNKLSPGDVVKFKNGGTQSYTVLTVPNSDYIHPRVWLEGAGWAREDDLCLVESIGSITNWCEYAECAESKLSKLHVAHEDFQRYAEIQLSRADTAEKRLADVEKICNKETERRIAAELSESQTVRSCAEILQKAADCDGIISDYRKCVDKQRSTLSAVFEYYGMDLPNWIYEEICNDIGVDPNNPNAVGAETDLKEKNR